MSQIVFTAIGSAGDVHPLLGIGRALARRGHRVVFCSHPPFEELALKEGFRFVPIGTRAEYESAINNPALWHPRTSFRTLWNVIAPSIRPHYDALCTLVDDDTVLVGTLWAFAARLMQELHQVPYISVQISPSTLLSAIAPPTHKRMNLPTWLPLPVKKQCLAFLEKKMLDKTCGPALNQVRASLGLPPATRILGRWMHSTDSVLCLFPAWFATPQADWPTNHWMSGFPLFDDVAAQRLDGEVTGFLAAGNAPVVFTPGSTGIDAHTYFGAVDKAIRNTGMRAIVLARNTGDRWRDRPDVLVREFVPMSALLPRCAGIVHHGGIGTAALAYAAGVPQIVTPFAHDQFDNAQRIVKSGCGVRLDSPIYGAVLTEALKSVIRNPEMASRCAEAAQRVLQAGDCCDAAAQHIEGFASRAARVEKKAA